jgi:hypothetical protein
VKLSRATAEPRGIEGNVSGKEIIESNKTALVSTLQLLRLQEFTYSLLTVLRFDIPQKSDAPKTAYKAEEEATRARK